MRLFWQECRRVRKSVVYWLFVAGLVGFLAGQSALPIREGDFSAPQPGDEQGVLVPSNDPEKIMPEAAAALLAAWQSNRFTTYPPPLGLYRQVTLSESQHAALGALLGELYGTDAAALPRQSDGGGQLVANADGSFRFVPEEPSAAQAPALRPGLDWETFRQAMAEADRLLGGGSDWAVAGLARRYGRVPAAYADLLAEYEAAQAHDRYTGAYARLFCDYAVIAIALFGAFPAVALFLQDRRGAAAVVYARRCGSARLVLARLAALLALEYLPVLILDTALTVYYAGLYGWGQIAVGAFFAYSALWLLPTLLLGNAAALLLTAATGTPAGAAVVPVLGWLSIMQGAAGGLSTGASYGSLLVPRHNTVGAYLVFAEHLPALLWGRGAACVLGLALAGAAVWAVDQKRKGAVVWAGSGLRPKRS